MPQFAAPDHSILPAIRPGTSLAVIITLIDMKPMRKPACHLRHWLVIFLAVLLFSSISRSATIQGYISTKRGKPMNGVTVTMNAQGVGGRPEEVLALIREELDRLEFAGEVRIVRYGS